MRRKPHSVGVSELIKVTHGVWRRPETVEDLVARAAAILSACPPGTVVSGLTAARLHGLWLPPGRIESRIEVIIHAEVPVPAARCASRRPELRARRRRLHPGETVSLDGLAITTEARTWFDLASILSLPDLVALGDSALRGTATTDELEWIVRRAGHRPGVIRARAALPLLDRRSRSRPESHLRVALVTRGLPQPAVNVAIRDRFGGWLAEPDLSYDDVRLAIEYNGAEHADVDRLRSDMTRGVDVIGSGWRSLSVGPVQVFHRPDQLAALVSQLRADPLPLVSGAFSTSVVRKFAPLMTEPHH